MTISYSSISSAAQAGSTSVLLRQPASLSAGDLVLWACTSKYAPNGPATPTGFTPLADIEMSGGGAAGTDTGNASLGLFYKVSDGTEDGATETITITSGNAATSRSVSYARSAGSGWSIAVASFENASSASWSGTTGSLDLAAGDMVVLVVAQNSDIDLTHSSHSISASGLTFGSFTSRQVGTGTTQGDDCALAIWEVPVTAGSGTGGVTVSFNLSGTTGTSAGIVALVRLRESGAGPTPISFSGTIPTITGTQGVALDVDLSGYFGGSLTPFSFTKFAGQTLQSGLSINSSAHLVGTPAAGGTTTGHVVRGTDTGSNVADSNAFSVSIASNPSSDVGYYGIAQTSNAPQQHTTASHSFFHAGFWWTFMKSGSDWNLYKETGNVPGSPGGTVDFVSSAHLSSVHTGGQCTVCVDSANNKAYVLGFSTGASTTVFRVLSYSAGAWSVTQSFNLTGTGGVGLGSASTFGNHGKLSIGVDPNGVPYVVAGNKGTGASATNGCHIAWPDSAASLGGTWSFKTIDSGPATEGDSSGRFAGVFSQGGTSYITVVYSDDSTSKIKMAYHAVETTLSNYSSGWTIVDIDATLSVDNHVWGGVMNYGGDQVVVTIMKCGDGTGFGRLYAFTSKLGSSLSWTHKRHRITNGQAEAGALQETPSRPVGVLDQINGEVYAFYHVHDSYPYEWIGYKKATLAALLAASTDTSVFDISVGENATPIINDESLDSASDVKTPAHPIAAGMGYFPVTALITSASTTGDSIWWNKLTVETGVSGSANQQVGTVSQSSSAGVLVSGSASQSMQAASQAATAAVMSTGSAAQAVGTVLQSSALTALASAAAAQFLQSVTQQASAGSSIGGSASQSMAAIPGGGAAASELTGSQAATISAFVQIANASAVEGVVASASQIVSSVISTGIAQVRASASATQQMAVTVSTGQAQAGISASAAQQLQAVLQSADLDLAVYAAASSALSSFSQSASGTVTGEPAQNEQLIASFAQVASGVVSASAAGGKELGPMLISSFATVSMSAQGDISIRSFTQLASAYTAIPDLAIAADRLFKVQPITRIFKVSNDE